MCDKDKTIDKQKQQREDETEWGVLMVEMATMKKFWSLSCLSKFPRKLVTIYLDNLKILMSLWIFLVLHVPKASDFN